MIIYNGNRVNVVGVVGDVKMEGAREPVKPTVHFNDPDENQMFSVRLDGQDIPGVLTFIDETSRDFSLATPLRRSFVSDIFGTLYESDESRELCSESVLP